MIKFFQKHKQLFILLFCLTIGFFLRSYNLNWDQGLLFHPDERNIDNAVTKIHFFSQLNPGFFAYGGFSIYLYRTAGDFLVGLTNNLDWVANWGKINVIGRFFSVIFSTFTILPLFFVAKKIFGKKVAYLSCFFYIFTVTSIQESHFATTESSLTFFSIVLTLISLFWLEKPDYLKSLLFGSIFGIALADKTSALSLIILPLMSLLLYTLSVRKNFKKLLQVIPQIMLIIMSSVIFFFLLSPFTILDLKDFLASMHYESGVATGSLPVVYTYQFNGSIPYVFQIQNFIWQFGPLLTIFGVLGLTILIFEPLKKKQANRILFWIFPLLYFVYVGSWHTKFIRYMTPLIPYLVISGSYLLVIIQQKFKKLGNLLIILSLLTTVLWASAFFNIYLNPQTRIAASLWMYKNIPTGSKILTEAWDDELPVPIEGSSPAMYNEEQLDMYTTDGPQKIIYLSDKLSHADYVAINSKRIYGTLIRLTAQYPITSNYYKLLFAGKLGYTKVNTFASYPNLFGINIIDDSAEETFKVYDHPKAIIFKNAKHYTENQLEEILKQ